jgi:hypothetical protein
MCQKHIFEQESGKTELKLPFNKKSQLKIINEIED